MPPRAFARFIPLALIAISACRDGAGPREPDSVEKVSGDGQQTFAGATLPNPIVVRVRGTDGQPLGGVRIAWDVLAGDGEISPAFSTTNASGIAEAEWTLGTDAGSHEATATVTSLDPARFLASTFAPPDCFEAPQSLTLGTTLTLSGAQASEMCVSAGAGGGEYVAIVHHGGASTDTLSLQAHGAFQGAFADLADVSASLSVGASQHLGAPPVRVEGMEHRRDDRFHLALRRRERALAPMIPVARAVLEERGQLGGITPRLAIGTQNPLVGDLVTINAQSRFSCTNPINKQGRIAAISDRAIIVHDTENPAGGFSDAEYQSMALTFDTLIDPLAVQNFGEPSDIDVNDRAFIFYTNEVNKLTERGSGSYVGGFYFVRDLFPKVATQQLQGCAASNEAEVFYMLVPDPEGDVSDARSKEFVLRVTLGTIAHEYQHLINASRRIFENDADDFETTWMDEGLSHIAEELTFYESAGLGPESNLDLEDLRATAPVLEAFNRFGINNFFRFEHFLEEPSSNSPYNVDDELSTRGAAWHFLRYAADRLGGDERDFWFDLVNSQTWGITNLENALGSGSLPWFRDWASTVMLDDYNAGTPATLAFPSWDLRSIFTARSVLGTPLFSGGEYSLAVANLAGGTPVTRTLIGGGVAHLRMALGSSAVGAIQIRTDGGDPDGDVTVTLVRTR